MVRLTLRLLTGTAARLSQVTGAVQVAISVLGTRPATATITTLFVQPAQVVITHIARVVLRVIAEI